MRPFCAARLPALVLLLALSGCAVHDAMVLRTDAPPPVLDCDRWYRDLDARIDAAGVRDAQARRIDGFPYLRIDRLTEALRPPAGRSEAAQAAWRARLAQLDLEARGFESRNLLTAERAARRAGEAAHGPAREVLSRAQRCVHELLQHDFKQRALRDALAQRAVVPDDYSVAQRVLGVYALTRLVFAAGIQAWQDEVRAAFAETGRSQDSVRYYVLAGERMHERGPAVAPGAWPRDVLGIPRADPTALRRLFEDHAPRFAIDTEGDDDRFGALVWRPNGRVPAVDPQDIVVYHHLEWTRYAQDWLVQLVYTIWFPRRPADGPFDLLAGELDGLTWRVTLSPQGRPILVDSIHPCGCFHMFFPSPSARPRPAPDALEEWAFAPASLPEIERGAQLTVRLSARTHQIVGIAAAAPGSRHSEAHQAYRLRDYDDLRSLPLPGGGTRSAFGPDGLIAGSARAERFLFWPMGIASAGAMRQRGRQPTAFVGRRHFDDPDLIERRFMLELEPARR